LTPSFTYAEYESPEYIMASADIGEFAGDGCINLAEFNIYPPFREATDGEHKHTHLNVHIYIYIHTWICTCIHVHLKGCKYE